MDMPGWDPPDRYPDGVDLDIRAVEHELCRIPEVNAARIVIAEGGRPTEVHILASPEKHAKQVCHLDLGKG